MKKGQTAVPTILLTVMALIIWYVLWIYPQQRYELLFGEEEVEVPEESEEALESVLFQTSVGEVGQSTGELLQTQTVKSLSVSYPETLSQAAGYDDVTLTSNLLASEHKLVTIEGDEEGSGDYTLELDTSSVKGSPKLKVTLNNSILYYSDALSDSKTRVEITDSNIEDYGNLLRVTCEFTGVQVWTSQTCGFDSVKLYEKVFVPSDVSDSDVFYLNPEAENAGLIELSFTPTMVNDYSMNLLINDEAAYSGKLSEDDTTLSLETEDIPLSSDNNITLIAQEGAQYTLSNINMSFHSIPSGMAAKYVVFNLNQSILEERDFVTFEYEVTGIVEPGGLVFEVLNTDSTYIVEYEDIVLGTNEFEVNTNDLEETNNLKIYSGVNSDTGRLIIDELKIK